MERSAGSLALIISTRPLADLSTGRVIEFLLTSDEN